MSLCPVTGLSAFSIPAFVFGQRGRECIICHETSCAIVVYLFSNLEKLSHSSTFSPLNSQLVFLTSLWMRWSCIFFFFLVLILPCQLLQLWKYFWEQSIKCGIWPFVLRIILLVSTRGTNLSKTKACWMLWIYKMRTLRHSHGPEGLSKCPS